jgi:cyclopropane fatty-acyl-phospholipid synthase-like methyltransferase
MSTTPAKFWDKHARKYAAHQIKDMAAYEYTLGRTRSYLKPTDRVLELGCGTGMTALALAPSVAQITGTDVSPEMVRIATERAQAQGQTNAAFRVSAAGAALAPVDVILGFNLFHLVENAESVFARAFAALPPGGHLISKTPCLADPSLGVKRFAFAGLIPVMRVMGVAPFVRRFTFDSLERAICAAGFDIIEAGNFPAMSRYLVARKP